MLNKFPPNETLSLYKRRLSEKKGEHRPNQTGKNWLLGKIYIPLEQSICGSMWHWVEKILVESCISQTILLNILLFLLLIFYSLAWLNNLNNINKILNKFSIVWTKCIDISKYISIIYILKWRCYERLCNMPFNQSCDAKTLLCTELLLK